MYLPAWQVINDPFVMLVVLLLVPVSGWWLARARFAARSERGLAVLSVGLYAMFATFVFPWGVFTIHLRWFPLLVWLASSAAALLHPPVRTLAAVKPARRKRVALIACAGVLLLFDADVIKGLLPPNAGIELAFPLKGGVYYVLQGGGSSLLNHHYQNGRDIRYALDIVQLDALGRRASGLLPESLDKYYIFHAQVYSPCSGEVVKIIDGWEDAPLFSRDADVLGGNQIVIDCGGALIWLEHLARDTILVTAGQSVGVGEFIARVGSSGASSEPHLHIHAQAAAGGELVESLPITFGGRFPTRNMVYRPRGD